MRPLIDPAQRVHFRTRSTFERSNAHIKELVLPDKIMVRGHDKVSFCLMSSVGFLAANKILQYMILSEHEQAAVA